MGAWGAGSFENDTALDCAGEISSLDDITTVFDDTAREEEIDADQACRIIVAAECVAAMRGHRLKDMPAELAETVHGFGKPSLDLFETAREQVSAALGQSELLELWGEADKEDRAAFNRAMTDLVDRLNKPQKASRKPRKKKKKHFNNSPCSFCDKPMGEEQDHQFTITLMSDEISTTSNGGWAHLSCINAALHPKHMIQQWEIDDELLEHIIAKIDAEREAREAED